MKYKTPRYNTEEVIRDFLRSLPDEFEIVEPGMAQVRWPEGLTRERLNSLGDCYNEHADRSHALYAFAAIAPEEKKRKMKVLVTLDFGTHKVGPIESECEVTR